MADATYCRASPLVWDDEVFVGLSDLGRTVWFALLLGPQVTSLPGLQRGSAATLADTLRRSTDDVSAELAKLHELGRVCIVEAKRVVWVPNAPKYNAAESPNHIRAWWRRWGEIPDCYPKWAHVATLKQYAGLANGKHADAWALTFGPVEDEASGRAGEALAEPFDGSSVCACARARAADAAADAGAATGAASGTREGRTREPKPDADPSMLTEMGRRAIQAMTTDPDLMPIIRRPIALAIDMVSVAPGVDVASEVRAAGAWLRANPTRRKTNGNQFLLGWVKRAQERRGNIGALGFNDHRGRPRQGHVDDDIPEGI